MGYGGFAASYTSHRETYASDQELVMAACGCMRLHPAAWPAEVTNADPVYHFKAVTAALKLAKEKLPKVGRTLPRDGVSGRRHGKVNPHVDV